MGDRNDSAPDFGEAFWDNLCILGTKLPPGDCNRDGQVTLADLDGLADCLLGPNGGLGPNCECTDGDNDGDTDLQDFAMIQNELAP